MKSVQTVVKTAGGGEIDESTIDFLEQYLGKKAVDVRKGQEAKVDSLTLTTKKLRNTIKDGPPEFRRALRGLPLELQDIQTKRRKLSMGEVLQAPVYVKDAKAVGMKLQTKSVGSGGSSAHQIGQLRDTLEEWAHVKIPVAVLLLITGGTLYGAYRLARVTEEILQDQATLLEEAATSEEGLNRAIQAKSGIRRGVSDEEEADLAAETEGVDGGDFAEEEQADAREAP